MPYSFTYFFFPTPRPLNIFLNGHSCHNLLFSLYLDLMCHFYIPKSWLHCRKKLPGYSSFITSIGASAKFHLCGRAQHRIRTYTNTELFHLSAFQLLGRSFVFHLINQLGTSSVLQKHVFFSVSYALDRFFPPSFQILLPCHGALHYMGSLHGGGMVRWMKKELSSPMANQKKKIMKLEHQVKKSKIMRFGDIWGRIYYQAKNLYTLKGDIYYLIW